jgi:phage gp29-like protein
MGDVVPLRQLDSITLNPPVARREIARPIRGLDTYNSHPGRGIEPQMIVSIFRQAERGDPVKQFDLFDDMIENDGHLRGLIDTRKQSVSSKPWVLRSGKPGHAPSDRAAVDLEERLRLHLGFRDFLEHQSSAPFYGFAATNIVWDVVGGLVTPAEFINVAHRRFAAPSEERAHEIMLITGEVGRMSLTPLQPGVWALTRYQHRNPWAAGLMRTATWFAYFKRLAHRNWQVFADMFGLPLVIGYYDEGASATTRAALEEACRMIGEDGYAVLSKLGEIVVKENARSGDASSVYPAIADRCDAEQSKLIAGATLNTDVDGKGSYALASVHESRAFEMIGADAERIAEMFVRDVGLPFVRFNGYGDDAAPPRLKIQLSRDSLERAKVVQMIGQAIPIDEDQLREEFGLRAPSGAGVKFPSKTAGEGSAP